nr:retrotransposon protein, putative, Ty1-copia subclass [Tanacetum cinerariifolium]
MAGESRCRIEGEISEIYYGLLKLLDEKALVGTKCLGQSKVVYLTMKDDYYRYLVEVKADDERRQVVESVLNAYKSAQEWFRNQKNKPYKAAKGGHGKGKSKIGYAPNNVPFALKSKTPPPPKKDNPRNCPMYLAELLKKQKQVGSASSSDMVRSMMNLTTLSLSFWDYALESATRILNMVPTKKVDKTSYELWYGKVPNLSYLKVWGREALVKRDTPDKPQHRSVKCIFIGYPKETMGYYFYFPPENKIVVARYDEFFEKNLITQEVIGRAIDLEEIQDEDTSPSEITSEIPMEVEGFEPPQEEVIPIRRQYGMVLVDLPPGCKIVGSKWIFKKKTDMDGIVHTYKARLVAKGYTQLYEVDYEETLSPVAGIRSIRILISIAAYYDYEI